MAFQRPFLISLKKSDSQQPWGFRVFGGKDYEEPHVVQKVAPDSVAEHSGLREGDEIIQIGRVNIQDLTYGQVQELIARCGSRIEMFIIREDLLTPKTGKEPPCIKAVVHNPYNSPLQLYSTENIADALGKQTEVLTDGRISSADEEEGPENLTFKQKSAVFHLLEEQAKKEISPQAYSRRSPQRKAPPPPPPKPNPPAQVNHYDQVHTPQSPQRHTSTAVITPTQPVQSTHPLANQTPTISFKVTSKAYSQPSADHYQPQPPPKTQVSTTFKVGPPPPPRGSSQTQAAMTTVQRQQQQQYHYQSQHEQSYQYPQQGQQPFYPQQQQTQMDYQQQVRQQQEVHQPTPQYQPQPQYQQQTQHQQHQYQQQMHHQPHHYQPQQYQAPQYHQQERDQIFEPISVNTPLTYQAPPPQKYKVSWPPTENGTLRQMTPSPTPASPSKMQVTSVWPPRQPTVKELPRTGFNPAVLREQASGRRCVWPPPKADDELRSGRTTPQSPVGGRRVNWNPSPSPPTTRRSPFGSMSPQMRRKDISWPPPQPTANKENLPRPSPRLSRKSGRFDDYIRQQASNNVPQTYRPPPGTSIRHVEYS